MSSPIAGPAAAILAAPDTVDATGCGYVPPLPTVISPGVFAWSGWEYSHQWSMKALHSPAYYTWYIQKPGPTTVVYGRFSDTENHGIGLGAYNNYRWGAQNHIYPNQDWYVCWYD